MKEAQNFKKALILFSIILKHFGKKLRIHNTACLYTTLCYAFVKSLNLSETIKLGALVRDPPCLKPMIPQHVVCVKSLQLCPTLCDPMIVACQIPVHGILQARTLEWVCHSLLQGIFLTQGLNPSLLGLLHWQAGFLPLAPPGKPLIPQCLNPIIPPSCWDSVSSKVSKLSCYIQGLSAVCHLQERNQRFLTRWVFSCFVLFAFSLFCVLSLFCGKCRECSHIFPLALQPSVLGGRWVTLGTCVLVQGVCCMTLVCFSSILSLNTAGLLGSICPRYQSPRYRQPRRGRTEAAPCQGRSRLCQGKRLLLLGLWRRGADVNSCLASVSST